MGGHLWTAPYQVIASNKTILTIICFTLCIHIWPLIKVLRSKSFETSGFSPCLHHFFWKFQSLCQNQSLPCLQTRYGLLFSPGKPIFLTFDVEKMRRDCCCSISRMAKSQSPVTRVAKLVGLSMNPGNPQKLSISA